MLRKPIASAKRPNPFRYCGEYFDSETGTVYLRNRNYDTATGRFSSEDPIQNGLNWYTYCGNEPVRHNDPSGLAKKQIFKQPTKPIIMPPAVLWKKALSTRGGAGSGGFGKGGGGGTRSTPQPTATWEYGAPGEPIELTPEQKFANSLESSRDPFVDFEYNTNVSGQGWGWRKIKGKSEFHRGQDFGTLRQSPTLYSAWYGTVYFSNAKPERGETVIIKLDAAKYGEGKYILLQHMAVRAVEEGSAITPGMPLGQVGNTGGNYPFHLHLEVLLNADPGGPVGSSATSNDLPGLWSVNPLGGYAVDINGDPLVILHH